MRERTGVSCEQMQHVFGGLFEVIFGREVREGDFFGEEINFENVTFSHGVREVAFVAAIMFGRWSNIPSNFAMFTEGGARFSSDMGHNASARGSKGDAIEVVIAEKGGMG